MTQLRQTTGIAVFVLRRASASDTEVLLLRGEARGGWSPVVGAIAADEREADAALRGVFEATALRPSRLYAATFLDQRDDPAHGAVGRTGVFVAFVEGDARVENAGEFGWHSIRRATPLLDRDPERRALGHVLAEYVQQPPDESLRVL